MDEFLHRDADELSLESSVSLAGENSLSLSIASRQLYGIPYSNCGTPVRGVIIASRKNASKKFPRGQPKRQPEKENKSRARQKKPHEPAPFLSVDNLLVEKKQVSSKPASAKVNNQTGENSISGRTQNNQSKTPRTAKTGFNSSTSRFRSVSRASSDWNTIVPSNFRTTPISEPNHYNHHIKSPFKHKVSKNENDKASRSSSPSHQLREATEAATYAVARNMAKEKPEEEKRKSGKLVKGKLKPMYPVSVDGPTVQQCRGIVAEPQFSNQYSRTLQRRRNLLSTVQPGQQLFPERPQTTESVHRTSIASDLSEHRLQEVDQELQEYGENEEEVFFQDSDRPTTYSSPRSYIISEETKTENGTEDVIQENHESLFTKCENAKMLNPSDFRFDSKGKIKSSALSRPKTGQPPSMRKSVRFAEEYDIKKTPRAKSANPRLQGAQASQYQTEEEDDEKEDKEIKRKSWKCKSDEERLEKRDRKDDEDDDDRGGFERGKHSSKQNVFLDNTGSRENGVDNQNEENLNSNNNNNNNGKTKDGDSNEKEEKGSENEAYESKDVFTNRTPIATTAFQLDFSEDAKPVKTNTQLSARRPVSKLGHWEDCLKPDGDTTGLAIMGNSTKPEVGEAEFVNKEEKKSSYVYHPQTKTNLIRPVSGKQYEKCEPLRSMSLEFDDMESMGEASVPRYERPLSSRKQRLDSSESLETENQRATPKGKIVRGYSAKGKRPPPQERGPQYFKEEEKRKQQILHQQKSSQINVKQQFFVMPNSNDASENAAGFKGTTGRYGAAQQQRRPMSGICMANTPSKMKRPESAPMIVSKQEDELTVAGNKVKHVMKSGICNKCHKPSSRIIEFTESGDLLVCEKCVLRQKVVEAHSEINNSNHNCDEIESRSNSPAQEENRLEGNSGNDNIHQTFEDLESGLNAVQNEIRQSLRNRSETESKEDLDIIEDDGSDIDVNDYERLNKNTHEEKEEIEDEEEEAPPTKEEILAEEQKNDLEESGLPYGQMSTVLTGSGNEQSVYSMKIYHFQSKEESVNGSRPSSGHGGSAQRSKSVGSISTYGTTIMSDSFGDLGMMQQTGLNMGSEGTGFSVNATSKTLHRNKLDTQVDPVAPYPPLCFRVNARPPEGSLYLFAYGANMNPNRLSTLIRREVTNRLWGLLYGFKLVFNKIGLDFEAGGFPNIEFNQFSGVEGCLYTITPAELNRLDQCMGYPEHFEHVMLPVWMLNCDDADSLGLAQYCVPAVMYIAQDKWIQKDCSNLPNSFTVDQCLRSGDKLTPEYKNYIESLRVKDDDVQ